MEKYTTSITINTPASRVWEILTKPEYNKEVLGVDLIADWRVGGPVTYVHSYEGEELRDKAIVLAYDEPHLLKLSYLPALTEMEDLPENYQTITSELHEHDGVTDLQVTVQNIKGDFFIKHAPEVWGEVLRGLKQLAESE